MIRSLLIGAATLFVAAPALAHAGFIVPITESPDEEGRIFFHATFSDDFPQMEIGLTSDAWTIVTPAGEVGEFGRLAERPDRTILEATLEESGLYRFSSGERLGRTGEVARIAGTYFLLGGDGLDKETLPEEADVLTSQTATVSDLYLAFGKGPHASLESEIGRLAIRPGANPADIRVGERFGADVLFDGAPLAGYDVTLFSPGSSREEGEPDTALKTDESGRLAFTASAPGEHLLMVRHIAPSPDRAETDVRSYTTTLTLLVEAAE
ncbi:DUF4198 domain-containing protein [Henriciella barbarensis]|uniref:DUF4198 domain-containing protein n=1 Tax=Henriciella barbarensis TaxID=86342 RepID=A0A399R655_9PROT|nr:DUF4198 domain-containing protein [Henriciella barbarensis]RIJ26021.1 DUF4198 domain-containing protein [Henriciella barbarensis]